MSMKPIARIAALTVALVAGSAFAGPETEAYPAGQSLADALKNAASSDIAWIAGGLLKEVDSTSLSSYLRFPTDTVSVVKLSGAQVKSALERSVSMAPSANPSFLQVSGLQVVYSKTANPDKRIQSVTVNGSTLDVKATYTVAMPTNLARGGLGYFSVWEKTAISSTLSNMTMADIAKDKSVSAKDPRYTVSD